MNHEIAENAKLVIEQFQEMTEFQFGYNPESIKWVDGFLNRQREGDGFTPDLCSGLVSTIGSFLGECIIAEYGGCWEQTEDGWSVVINHGNMTFPFSKVQKQLENGPEDSIYSFYTVIPVVFKDVLEKQQAKKPWWKIW